MKGPRSRLASGFMVKLLRAHSKVRAKPKELGRDSTKGRSLSFLWPMLEKLGIVFFKLKVT